MFVFLKHDLFCMREPGKREFVAYDDYRLFCSDLKRELINAKEIQEAVLREASTVKKTDSGTHENVGISERRNTEKEK